ncbi:bifunctional oligoribonuclease/PAP phosphatase NrnA [Thermodesulfobacteriota bacterium]
MIDKIARILREEDRFVVVTHVNPDGDAIGCLLGLSLALSEMGKKSWPLASRKVPDLYGFLPGIDRVATDISEIPERPSWIISVDAAEARRISGNINAWRDKAKLINIDHHATNPEFGDINYIDPSATSTAELVYQILKEAGYRLSPGVGKCLYTGIITDTGGFRFAGVNSRTLQIGSEILASGFDSYDVAMPLFEEMPITRFHLERLVLDRMEVLLDGKLIISTLYREDFIALGADKSESENLVDRLREIRGAEAGVLITANFDDLTRVSLRSKHNIDVAEIAGAFGGGGHKRAAGIRTDIPVDELKKKLEAAIGAALNDGR